MYQSNKSSSRRFPARNGGGRQIKYIPKNVLLNAILDSQKSYTGAVTVQEERAEHEFKDFGFHPTILQNIVQKGFTSPTPIQDKVIGAIMENRDVIGMADTGTGKTAAFLIPMLNKIANDRNQRVLVVAPTRELSVQIHREMREIGKGMPIRSAMIIGGANQWRQRQDIRNDPHIVIATPGRLKEFIQLNLIRLSGFRNVILDEADRMVDIGFINDIKYFISLLPSARQSLFFSATITGRVNEILDNFVKDPVRVSVKTTDTATTIKQDVIRVNGTPKVEMLHDLLIQKGFEKVLVFGRTKWGVERLHKDLTRRGFNVMAIHGNKRQNQRQQALDRFSRNEIQVLLATDVASRGLDIPDVTHVINYDLPETMEDYIHRIGRTGRANKAGIALTFVE